MELRFHWFDYEYFPYEKTFAENEIRRLFSDVTITRRDDTVLVAEIPYSDGWADRASRLTYVQCVESENDLVIPTQAKLELSDHAGRTTLSGNGWTTHRLTRQQTRYSSHGIHEYKGKFNPQVVRAIGNSFGWEAGDWILDPFAGSGTTLVEAKHSGWNAIGIEINSLAVKIANSKLRSLEVPIDDLQNESTAVVEDLQNRFADYTLSDPFSAADIESLVGPGWKSDIQGLDYLENWFVESVLVQIHAIQNRLSAVDSGALRSILETILSDQLRDASLQDSGDLRTRKANDPPANYPLVTAFAESVAEYVETVSRARAILPETRGYQRSVELDSREFATHVAEAVPDTPDDLRFDGALTSPPYASALPYVDTNRLSLYLFGHIDTGEMRRTARSLIGSRNIRDSTRSHLYDAIEANEHDLPAECISFCRTLKNAVDLEEDGFRRQNRPALVYKYLSDMKQSLEQTRAVLKPGSPYGLIVGRNTTELGGEEYVIDNPALLAALGEQVGYAVTKQLELDAHHRFDMHNSTHSIDTEQLLVLEK